MDLQTLLEESETHMEMSGLITADVHWNKLSPLQSLQGKNI